jgi:hypothetical protein
MTLARTNIGVYQSSGPTYGVGSFTTPAFTPPDNSLLVVIVRTTDMNNTIQINNVITLANSASLTQTNRVNTPNTTNWKWAARVWTMPVTTGVSMTLTADCDVRGVEQYTVEVYAYTGYNTGSPIGATATGNDADGNGAASITLSGAPATDSEVLAGADVALNSGTSTVSPGAGWTELSDVALSGFLNWQTQARTASTSTTVAWADLATGSDPLEAVMWALEIKAAGGAAIDLAAAATDVAAASAALSTQVRLAASATDVASASAALTTAIRLAAAAVDAAAATGTLAGGATLGATAIDVAVAVGALSTAIAARGSAVDVAVASGALTNWASVTLAGTLYTGQGGALDSHFWLDSVPAVGTTIYYDATHLTIYPNAEVSSDTNSCAAIVQFFDGTSWALGLIVITPGLAANAESSALASAQFTTGVQLVAAANALAAATGAFSTGAGMAASASDAAAAAGALTTKIPLSALALNVVTSVAGLTTQIGLAASAQGRAASNADLNGVIAMAGAGAAVATFAGALSTGIQVSGAAQDSAPAVGSLTTTIRLSGVAQAVVSAASSLATTISLNGAAASSVNATGNLSTARILTAAAIDVASALATIGTGISLAAHAAGITQASGELNTASAAIASAQAESTVTAVLTDVIETPPVGAYITDDTLVVSLNAGRVGTRITPRFRAVDPEATDVLTFDLSDQLANGETLKGRVSLQIACIAGMDANATTLFWGVASFDRTGTKILQPRRGGLDGSTYLVKVSAATTNPQKRVALTALLPVRG